MTARLDCSYRGWHVRINYPEFKTSFWLVGRKKYRTICGYLNATVYSYETAKKLVSAINDGEVVL